jgi:hypothetical protein
MNSTASCKLLLVSQRFDTCSKTCWPRDAENRITPNARATNGILTVGGAYMADWIAVLIGLAGLGFAYYEHQKRTKVETVVRNALRRLAGDVKVVFSNANWSDVHFRNIGYMFIEDPPNLTNIRRQVVDGPRDAAACARQLGLIHSQIRGIQQSLFNDSEETFPEILSDDVVAAQPPPPPPSNDGPPSA